MLDLKEALQGYMNFRIGGTDARLKYSSLRFFRLESCRDESGKFLVVWKRDGSF